MKILIVDPDLDEFGHHIGFNKHVLKMIQSLGDVIFLDVRAIMRRSYTDSPENLKFIDILDFSDSSSFKEVQKKHHACNLFWDFVCSLSPDVVIFTSECCYRKYIYTTLPVQVNFNLYVICHAVWSLLKSFSSNKDVSSVFKEKVDGIFVLEPFLVNNFIQQGYKSYWFPHRGYFCAPEIKGKRNKNKPIAIGMLGVINERRNHDFVINCLTLLKEDFEFYLAGQLIDSVKESVYQALEKLKKNGVNVIERFGYQSDLEFQNLLNTVDLGILAYDDTRSLQASGALYSYTEFGVPLLVPNTKLFFNYEKLYPELLRFYEPLCQASFMESLKTLVFDIKNDQNLNFLNARCKFFSANNYEDFILYISDVLNGLSSPNNKTSWLAKGNEFLRKGSSIIAEGYYLASICQNPNFRCSYDNLEYIYNKRKSYDASHGINLLKNQNAIVPNIQGALLSSDSPITVFVYPEFHSKDNLDDFMVRMFWHLFPVLSCIDSIHIISKFNDIKISCRHSYICSRAYDLEALFLEKIVCHKTVEDFNRNRLNISFSLVWFYKSEDERRYPFPRTLDYLYKKPIWRVDEVNERFATSHFLKAISSLYDVSLSRKRARDNLFRIKDKFINNHIAVFGTGPSLSNAFEFSFNDVDTIASNSMVNNIDLLDHIRPKLFVCADPIFHAGVSTYAEEFRQKLLFSLKRYNSSLLVPERDLHIYNSYYAGCGITIVPVPFRSSGYPNYNLPEEFCVESTGNILTLFLLQIGLSFADKIDIYGCDGRPVCENSYFWKHDKSAQLNDKMDDIKQCHPGFFNISYDEYYDEHCNTLELWLASAESIGKKIESKTFSYIPALVARNSYKINAIK